MQYLVDSDWVIDHLNGIRRVTSRLDELAQDGLALSIVSLCELYDGMYGAVDQQDQELQLAGFLESVEVVPLDDAICRIFARERRRLRAAGNIIGDLDLMIGATALHHGLTLLTNNRRHLRRIEGLDIISL